MTGQPGIYTFLIADIRGYSRYTDEFGAEAAAGLTAQFVNRVTEDVESHGWWRPWHHELGKAV